MARKSVTRLTVGAAALVAIAFGVAYAVVGGPAQEAKLVASDAAKTDRLGISVAVSGDTAVAGAPRKDSSQGAAYVFTRTGTTWAQQAKLMGSDAAADDEFGYSVAVAGDTAVVGADSPTATPGAAYVFTRTGTAWTQQAKLTASDAVNGDNLGVSVALEGDGALVGASNKNSNQGAAYVFTRTGTTWTQQAKLTAADAANSDELGYSVALSGDTAIAGAYGVSAFRGAAYVFTRTGVVWTQQTKLSASDGAGNQAFGVAVALVGDTAVVGGGSNLRGAYVFTRTGSAWTQSSKFTAADGVPSGGGFGGAVATSGDTLVVGADSKTFDTGAAYVFDLAPAGGPPEGYVLPAKVKAKSNTKHREKSTLVASGTLDTGTGAPDFSGPATFDVADFRLAIPAFVAKGRALTYSAGGVTLTIKPSASGSSRATFAAKVIGDLGGRVELNSDVPFNFSNHTHNLSGTAKLTIDVLAPHGVTAPGLAVLAAAATVKGGGRDALALKLAFATDGVVPGVQADLTIGFGGTYTSVLAGGWVRKGSTYVHSAKAPGIRKATIDYVKGTITIVGSRLDLGAFTAGGNPVVVTVTRGTDTRSVAVRTALTGTKLAY